MEDNLLDVILKLDDVDVRPCVQISLEYHLEYAVDHTSNHSESSNKLFNTFTNINLPKPLREHEGPIRPCNNHLPVFIHLVEKFPEMWAEVTDEYI